MSRYLTAPPQRRRFAWLALVGVMLSFAAALTALPVGCEAGGRRAAPTPNLYPPAPQPPRAIALGNLRGGEPPDQTQIQISLVLFGTEPLAPVQLASPIGVAAAPDRTLLICDLALRSVLRWSPAARTLADFAPPGVLVQPYAVSQLPDGRVLVCDRQAAKLLDARGRVLKTYVPPFENYRPGDALTLENESGNLVWVTNLAAHRIEVFELETGKWLRHIGNHGDEPGEFALPRTMDRTPAGDVCVVDVLNNRVQIIAPDGAPVGVIGGPGDKIGTFGRPRDVAVGPDGTIFVVDAFSQRVHVFAPDGAPLLAFGEPGSGFGELALPGGIAISEWLPDQDLPYPAEHAPAYYVLVTEQLAEPGVRIFGWLPPSPEDLLPDIPESIAANWRPPDPALAAESPHWKPGECTVCHQTAPNGDLLPIPPDDVDALCFSCHDGIRAFADPHPIGRPAVTDTVVTPDQFPTHEGEIGCLTCHDIDRHCAPDAERNPLNPGLLRHYDPRRPLDYCSKCHVADVGGRFNPHLQRDARGRVREDACLFCHTQRPAIPPDGTRQFEPQLRNETSAICLNCHTKHWDLSPEGHVDRPVPEDMRHWMVMRELSLRHDLTEAELEELARKSSRGPAHLPLGNGMVTCYTCHNPHYTGLFPEDSELGALADNPSDRAAALRTDWINLCSECHRR